MHQAERVSLESIRSFLQAGKEIRFKRQNRQQSYTWVEQVLVHQQYASLGNADRGLVRRYIEMMTGLSRAQTTRLMARCMAGRRVEPTIYKRHSFQRRYTTADVELLAQADEAHEVLSGPATRRIQEREQTVYGKAEYVRLRPTDQDKVFVAGVEALSHAPGSLASAGKAKSVLGSRIEPQRTEADCSSLER